jgi:hypothetical protein
MPSFVNCGDSAAQQFEVELPKGSYALLTDKTNLNSQLYADGYGYIGIWSMRSQNCDHIAIRRGKNNPRPGTICSS